MAVGGTVSEGNIMGYTNTVADFLASKIKQNVATNTYYCVWYMPC